MKWYIGVLKKYAVFCGRARRKEYWMFVLFHTIFIVLALGIDIALLGEPEEGPASYFFVVYCFASLLPSISVPVF